MTRWKKLCCAVDFSEPSRVALERAADLARELGAELTLVHVEEKPAPAASDVLVSSRGVAADVAQDHARRLEAWRAEAERRAGAPVGARVLSGDAATEIVRDAREAGCGLLVVGTHGRGGVRRLLLGSVAEHVVRNAECPVLVERDHGRAEERDEAEELAQYRSEPTRPAPR